MGALIISRLPKDKYLYDKGKCMYLKVNPWITLLCFIVFPMFFAVAPDKNLNISKNLIFRSHCELWHPDVLQWRHDESEASQITTLTIVYSIVYSGADKGKHQSSSSLAFVWGIHRWPVNSPHKGTVTRKCLNLMTSSWSRVWMNPTVKL